MKAQIENQIMSSLLLYVDNIITKKGEAFSNQTTKFFKKDSRYQGYDHYAAPYKQLVPDRSIPGANILSGVTVNGSPYVSAYHVNYKEGSVYFPTAVLPANATVSGSYAVKEFNVYLTSALEEELLFESKVNVRPKFAQALTGVNNNVETYPAVFVKNNGYTYKPFTMGGTENMLFNARLIIMADSQFSADAVTSILMESARDYVPMIGVSELPFNALGASHFYDGQSGQNVAGYNYDTLSVGKIMAGSALFIKEVTSMRSFPAKNLGDAHVNRDLYPSIVDYTLEFQRNLP